MWNEKISYVYILKSDPIDFSEMTTPSIGVVDTDGRDFCSTETAAASCSEGEHVNVLWGLLGRMKQGRCIRDTRSLDCYDDVGAHLRDICRGQQSCYVGVSTLMPLARSCPPNLAVYLHADFECVDGKYN